MIKSNNKVALILCGCGAMDGSEISEATYALLSLSMNNVEYEVFAPNVEFDVISHLDFKKTCEKRNALTESARITRGLIKDLKDLDMKKFDALVLPGGFGIKETLMKININDIIKQTYEAKKPIVAICISPALITKNIDNSFITFGPKTSKEELKAKDIICLEGVEIFEKKSNEFLFDEVNKIYTTPAFMWGADANLKDVFDGIHGAISKMLESLKL